MGRPRFPKFARGKGVSATPGDTELPYWRRRTWWRIAGRTSIAFWVSTVATFAGTALAARTLGVKEYGSVVLAIAVAGLVVTLLDITLEEGVVHHGFRVLREGDVGALRVLLRAAFVVDVAVGVGLASMIAIFAEPLANLASSGDTLAPSLVRLAAVVPLAGAIDGTTGAVLLLSGRPDLRAWCLAAGNVVRLGAMVVAVAAGGGATAVVIAYGVAAVVLTVVQGALAWRLAWREWAQAKPTRTVRSWIRPLTSFGIHTSLATSIQSGEQSLVPVILGALSGPAAAGIYAIAIMPLTITAVVSAPVRLLVFPEQAKMAAEGAVGFLRRSVRLWIGVSLAIGVPAGVVGWFLAPSVIPAVFGQSFDAAVLPARIMLISAVLHLASGWTKTLPAAVGRPQLRSGMSLAFVAISVSVTVIFAGPYGTTAAAAGNLAASVMMFTAWWFLVERVLRGVRDRGVAERAAVPDPPPAPVGAPST